MLRVTKSRFYVVPVLMRTLDILELLCESNIPLKSNEVSIATGVPQTTTYRILRTLVHRGYVAQDFEGRFTILSLPAKSGISPRSPDPAAVYDLKFPKEDLSSDQVISILHRVIQALSLANERPANERPHDNKRANGRSRDRQL